MSEARILEAESTAKSDAVSSERSFWDRHAQNTFAMMASFVFHVAILLFLACFVLAGKSRGLGITLESSPGSSDGGEELSMTESFDLAPSEAPVAATESTTPMEFSLDVEASLVKGDAALNATLASALAATGGTGSGRRGDEGLGERLAKGGAAFFGAYAEGEKFVFVLDSSRSMAGSRWAYACDELMASLRGLESHQQFFVICFDVGPKCMFNVPINRARFYKNDEATLKRVQYWLETIQLGPATQPATSLRKALGMHPDAVFLLSDGELQDDTVPSLRAVNGFSTERKQTPVHAIHLMSEQGRSTLQLIARENSGSFTPITE